MKNRLTTEADCCNVTGCLRCGLHEPPSGSKLDGGQIQRLDESGTGTAGRGMRVPSLGDIVTVLQYAGLFTALVNQSCGWW